MKNADAGPRGNLGKRDTERIERILFTCNETLANSVVALQNAFSVIS
jgi:hypothetical protein